MKKTNISKFAAVGLCICALTGCGASPDEKPDTSNPVVNSNMNEENTNGSSENKGDVLESANLIGDVFPCCYVCGCGQDKKRWQFL